MADKQHDVSHKIQRLFWQKQKIREAIRLEVLARENSPYVNPAEMIDPAVIRYHALLTYRPEHMYTTPKNTFFFFAFFILPIMGTYCSLRYTQNQREKLYRSGQVAYKDRQFFQGI